MFNSLSDRLTATFKNLRGKGKLSEADVDATVREIRRALLDADVALHPIATDVETGEAGVTDNKGKNVYVLPLARIRAAGPPARHR